MAQNAKTTPNTHAQEIVRDIAIATLGWFEPDENQLAIIQEAFSGTRAGAPAAPYKATSTIVESLKAQDYVYALKAHHGITAYMVLANDDELQSTNYKASPKYALLVAGEENIAKLNTAIEKQISERLATASPAPASSVPAI